MHINIRRFNKNFSTSLDIGIQLCCLHSNPVSNCTGKSNIQDLDSYLDEISDDEDQKTNKHVYLCCLDTAAISPVAAPSRTDRNSPFALNGL